MTQTIDRAPGAAESFEDRIAREHAEESAVYLHMAARLPAIARAIGDGWRHAPEACERGETPAYVFARAGYLRHFPSGAGLHVSLNGRHEWKRQGHRLNVSIHLGEMPDGRQAIPRDFWTAEERANTPTTAITLTTSKTDHQIGQDIQRRLVITAIQLAERKRERSQTQIDARLARARTIQILGVDGLRPPGRADRPPDLETSVELYHGPKGLVSCRVNYGGDVDLRISSLPVRRASVIIALLRAWETI